MLLQALDPETHNPHTLRAARPLAVAAKPGKSDSGILAWVACQALEVSVAFGTNHALLTCTDYKQQSCNIESPYTCIPTKAATAVGPRDSIISSCTCCFFTSKH